MRRLEIMVQMQSLSVHSAIDMYEKTRACVGLRQSVFCVGSRQCVVLGAWHWEVKYWTSCTISYETTSRVCRPMMTQRKTRFQRAVSMERRRETIEIRERPEAIIPVIRAPRRQIEMVMRLSGPPEMSDVCLPKPCLMATDVKMAEATSASMAALME